MNYFAHARVAAEIADDAAFVLGSMLPDFAHMLGERAFSLAHDGLRSGARHHHDADAAFHRAPTFGALVGDGTRWLRDRGVARGPSRGAAHVGVELLLDGALVGDHRGDAAYLAALASMPRLSVSIRWRRPEAVARWQRLWERLRAQGVPHALRDPGRVADRIARVLEPRRTLRLAEPERRAVEDWLTRVRGDVVDAAPRLLAETFSALPGVDATPQRAASVRDSASSARS